MGFQELYQSKLTSPEKAVSVIKSGDWVDYGWASGHPVALDKALAARMGELTDLKIRGGICMWVPEIFKIDNPQAHFVWNSWHLGGIERKAIDQGFVFYNPLRYSELPRYYREHIAPPDVTMFQVSPMDAHGYFNFGPNTSHLKALCEVSKVIILEVNENMPRCPGNAESEIHISQVDMIVEGTNPSVAQMGAAAPSDVDEAVAKLIVSEIPNGACLQLGIGGMPNAVGSMIAQSDLKDLGIHTEMYVDAFVDMALAGKVNGSKKSIDRGRQVFAFAAGTNKLYDYIKENPAVMAAPVDYTNDIRQISRLDNFMSINNAVDLDLTGQVNSESSGIRHISGAGGQLDFVLGAYLSKGGKSFICCSSSYAAKDGTLHSRILPSLAPGSTVTDPRPTVHYVVTEYGMVCLKGLSTWERAEAIISIAHPQFREQLIKDADKLKIWRNSNR